MRRGAALVALAASLQPAFGHDTFQTTAVGKLNQENLEVQLTVSGFGASTLLQQSGVTVSGGMAASFNSARPKLTELAGKLIEVSADGVALSLTSALVVPGEEGDVEFQLTYPRPPKRELELHAAYLAQLGKGYTAQLTLFNEAGVGSILHLKERHQPVVDWSLDSGARLRNKPQVETAMTQPAAVAEATSPAPVAQPATSNPTQKANSQDALARKLPVALIVALIGVAGVAFWLLRRKLAR